MNLLARLDLAPLCWSCLAVQDKEPDLFGGQICASHPPPPWTHDAVSWPQGQVNLNTQNTMYTQGGRSGCCYGNATGGRKRKDKSWEFLHGIGWSGRHGLGGKGGELLRAHLAHLVRNSSDYKPRPDNFLAKSPAAASTTSQGSSKAFLAEKKSTFLVETLHA